MSLSVIAIIEIGRRVKRHAFDVASSENEVTESIASCHALVKTPSLQFGHSLQTLNQYLLHFTLYSSSLAAIFYSVIGTLHWRILSLFSLSEPDIDETISSNTDCARSVCVLKHARKL